MGRDGIEAEAKSVIPRCSETRNHIVTPAVTPTYREIPIFADGREKTLFARHWNRTDWAKDADGNYLEPAPTIGLSVQCPKIPKPLC